MIWLYGYLTVGLLIALGACFIGTRPANTLAIFLALLTMVLLWPLFLACMWRKRVER